jgi:glycosyltransferase involved in cell wall biosynthesis
VDDVSDEISVVIAAYNAAPFVDFCLTGVLNQTLQPTRVIAVDDASEDGTYEALRSWSDRLPMQVLRNSENTGAGSSRSRALAEIRGGKVAILDADDFWLPEHLQVLSSLIYSSKSIAVPRAAIWVSGQGLSDRSPFQVNLPRPTRQRLLLKSDNYIFNGSMFDSSLVAAVGGYPTARISEDYLFWWRALRMGAVLQQAPRTTVLYRRHNSNVSVANSDFFAKTADLFRDELGASSQSDDKIVRSIVRTNECRAALAAFDEGATGVKKKELLKLTLSAPRRLKISALMRLILGSRTSYQKIR